jgi:uncharacterized protein involved in response to NO
MESKQTWGGETRQNHLYKPFLRGALLSVLTIGCTLGALNLAVMGFGADLSAVWGPLIQAHAYGQMFGWVGLFIMGVAYHTLPRFYLRPLVRPQLVFPSFALVLAGLVLRFFAQPLAAWYPFADWLDWRDWLGWLVPLSALLGLAGVSLFAWAMYDTVRNGTDRFGATATRLFICAGLAWLWVASGLTLVVTVYMAVGGLSLVPPAWDVPYLRTVLSGAIVTIILGYTLRTVPHMLGLRPPNARLMHAVFAGYTLSVLAQVAADAGSGTGVGGVGGDMSWWLQRVGVFGAGGELVSLLVFVWATGVFNLSVLRVTQLARRNPWPERFIRTAYMWLLFSSGLNMAFALGATLGSPAPHAFVASYHHALTVGFISMMIIGMSMRVVPVFIGQMNRQTRLAGIIYALMLAGNTARIIGQSFAYLQGGAFYVLMGVSGFVEVCGLVCYAVALWRALGRASYGQAEERLG